MTTLDLLVLIGFFAVVIAVSLAASRGERTRADYFLASRGLSWWLVGFSLIASNISTEQFVGMTGSAARAGLAVASYELLAAPALVLVAWILLPRFLRAGLFTIPEFLEYRYDRATRTILAALMAVFFVLTVLSTVLYSGATFFSGILDLPQRLTEWGWAEGPAAADLAFTLNVWLIGAIATVYTVIGGLKAVVWSDLVQGGMLLLGGALVLFLALDRMAGSGTWLEAWQGFAAANADRLHLVRPWNDPDVPSLSLVTGLWIPVMFYWGLNQFITQRVLAAGSLAEGQKGIFFAAAIKLLLPLIVVLPGMMAVTILGERLPADQADQAYPLLLRELLGPGLLGLMLAAIGGAVMSTFNSGLNSAATVVVLDLYGNHVAPHMSETQAVRVGRWTTLLLAILACLWTPVIRSFEGVFSYIQELWGFVSAPTCAVFFAGLVWPRTPARAARWALLLGPCLYGLSRAPSWFLTTAEAEAKGTLWSNLHAYSSLAFLYHMFILFLLLSSGLWLWSRLAPLAAPVTLPDRAAVPLAPWRYSTAVGCSLLFLTLAIYCWWW
jgi:solute:Na+ symporter, SSS family